VTLENAVFGPFNTLTMQLGGTVLGDDYNHITFTGTAVLGGALDVVLIWNFDPAPGDSFDLFDGNTTGTFSSINLPALDPGLTWNTSEFASDGILLVVPEPGSGALATLGLMALGGARWRRRPS
jgi:hypothetical protein